MGSLRSRSDKKTRIALAIWEIRPGASVKVSSLLADAMLARLINQIFGTTHDAITLRRLEDAHIEELRTVVEFYSDPPKPHAAGAPPEAF
jgi:hypothetical protein